MKATMLDLRRNPGKIVDAIERNEIVTLSKRGKDIATITPIQSGPQNVDLKDTEFFGMWADREDMADPTEWVRKMREPRHRAI